ncbi:arylamine N-acetyltransferase [Tumebacillus sp. BK434]|uniref:arylamine N-acetyltransferase n=1 Tax=Tumebacillus sp. BK434 TaxID=2512169 RepID=UPI001048C9B6|nr:arylamine N-acetyltransferase [Tumebacillus sp. BK434]TCP56021.1 arylamine N-acetyltransferase [Tumebacillus sp. BK434]
MNWTAAYLQHLGLPAEAPGFAALERLCTAHLTRNAFENITKLYYFKRYEQTGWFIPPIDVFVEKMQSLDAGGTCFTHNTSFHRLLTALGYDAWLVGFNENHMGIAVDLPEGLHYVDVGVGAPVFSPIPLPAGGERVSCGVGVRIQDGKFQHLAKGNVTLEWEMYPEKKLSFADFADIIEKQNTPGQTFFMKTLRCQLWQPEQGRSISLVNNTLTLRFEDGSDRQEKLASLQEIKQVLAEEFRLPLLPVEEAAEVLARLGIDIFAPPET